MQQVLPEQDHRERTSVCARAHCGQAARGGVQRERAGFATGADAGRAARVRVAGEEEPVRHVQGQGRPAGLRFAVRRADPCVTSADCRCSATFCAACRFPDKHNCTFDFKALDRQELEKRNPAVVAEKIRKI